jgi:GcrA cell cycle regulator
MLHRERQAEERRSLREHEHPAGWTEQRVETLKSMWLEGASAAEIAEVLGGGVTRNGVIGKAHREKLTARGESRHFTRPKQHGNKGVPKAKGIIARSASRPVPGFRSEPLPEEREEGVDVTRLIGLEQLTERTCKFPIGDPLEPGFGFCGRPKPFDVKEPYCDRHARRARGG